MLKFYEEVASLLFEISENSDGEYEVKEGSLNTIQEYFNEMPDLNKYTLAESEDNKEFVLSLTDSEFGEVQADLTLEDKEEFVSLLDNLDEDAIEDYKGYIKELLSESDYERFLAWSAQFESKYAWDGDSYA